MARNKRNIDFKDLGKTASDWENIEKHYGSAESGLQINGSSVALSANHIATTRSLANQRTPREHQFGNPSE